jgi:hypothetical protein
MPAVTDFPARGKVIAIEARIVVFTPENTNYELRLEADGPLDGAQVGVITTGIIRVAARKLWTVPSGGNFIEPIFGPPRKIQGRIRYLDDDQMVVQAGTPIVVALPADPSAYDLVRGPLSVGSLVNVSIFPGATFTLHIAAPATAAAAQPRH